MRRRRTLAVAIGGTVCAIALAGCTGAPASAGKNAAGITIIDSPQATGALRIHLHGAEPDQPIPLPAVTLTDTAGAPFNLKRRAVGKITLVYFGYTHCPDVCPTTLGDIAAALQQVPATTRADTQLVFVTTDPARDTPTVLRAWLDHFDHSFIGLTGSVAQLNSAAATLGVPLMPPEKQPDGSFAVAHGTQVFAFTQDGLAHVFYLAGTTPQDYVADLPALDGVFSGGA